MGRMEFPATSLCSPPTASRYCNKFFRRGPAGLSSPLFPPLCLTALHFSLLFLTCVHLESGEVCTHASKVTCVELRGQLAGVSPLLPPRGFWWQSQPPSLPIGLSRRSAVHVLKMPLIPTREFQRHLMASKTDRPSRSSTFSENLQSHFCQLG